MTGNDLRIALLDQARGWRALGSHVGAWIMPEFVARMGTEGIPQALPQGIKRGWPRACFQNAEVLARRGKFQFTEGFGITPNTPFFPIHHAWVIDGGNRVIDPTWENPDQCVYLGVTITNDEFYGEARRIKSWSILDTGTGLNIEWMVRKCPDLAPMIPEKFR